MKKIYTAKTATTHFYQGVNQKLKLAAKTIFFALSFTLITSNSFSQIVGQVFQIAGSCNNTCNGIVTFNAGGGTPPYTLNLSPGPLVTFTSSYNFTSACPGNLFFIITDALGNTWPNGGGFITIASISAPVASITANGSTTICSPDSVILSATSGPGYGYEWYKNGYPIPNSVNSTLTVTETGNYYCKVSAYSFPQQCVTVTNTISVTVINSTPSASIAAAGDTTFCGPGFVRLDASTDSGISFQWQLNGVDIPGGTLSYYFAEASGSYSCNVSTSCATTTSNIILVTMNMPSFTATATASGPTSFCSGDHVILNASPVVPGYTYSWRKNGLLAPSTYSSSNNFTYGALFEGNYTVIISDGICPDTSNIIPVTVNDAVTVVFQPNAAEGKDAVIFLDPNLTNSNFGASPDILALAILGAGGPNGPRRSFIEFDMSSIPTNAVVHQASLTLYNNPTSSNNGGTHMYIPNTNAAYLNAVRSPWNEYTITWNNQPGVMGAAGQSYIPPSTSPQQDYTIYISDFLAQFMITYPDSVHGFRLRLQNEFTFPNGLIFASSDNADSTKWPKFSITYHIPVPASITAGGPSTFCSAGSVTLNANTGPGLTYQWQLNSSAILGATSSSYVASLAGSYDCIVTNNCGSTLSNTIIVTVNSVPAASITAAGPTTFCSPGLVMLNANTGAGLSYQWRLNTVNITGATASSYSATATGTYDCIVTNLCGSTNSNTIVVTADSGPTAAITATGPTTFCLPGSVTLNANLGAGLSYQWRLNGGNISGATSLSYSASATGNYNCVVSNLCGSTTSNTIAVTVAILPATPGNITGQVTGACASTLVYSISSVSGATGYTWTVPSGASISNGQGSTSVNVAFTSSFSNGSISVVATNLCGNSGAASLTVAGPPDQPGNISGPSSVCHNQNNVNYTIAAVPGATSYTWTVPPGVVIRNGQGSTHIKVRFGNSAGNITVRANNNCGQSPVQTLAIAMPCREEPAEDDEDLTLYPNPASSQLTISASQFVIEKIEIFDAFGQSIYSQQPVAKDQKQVVDISTLLPGIFFIQITSQEQKKILKFIKQK